MAVRWEGLAAAGYAVGRCGVWLKTIDVAAEVRCAGLAKPQVRYSSTATSANPGRKFILDYLQGHLLHRCSLRESQHAG